MIYKLPVHSYFYRALKSMKWTMCVSICGLWFAQNKQDAELNTRKQNTQKMADFKSYFKDCMCHPSNCHWNDHANR